MGEWLQGDVDTVMAFDAEVCPERVPAGFGVAMPYIGGSSCARIWPVDELARVEHLPRLPIWVPTPGVDDPRRAAADCIARLRELGVPDNYRNGVHARVMWDLETGREPDRPWLRVARNRMLQAGYHIAPYLEISTLLHADSYMPCAGYVVANPTGKPHLYEHPNVAGTQYAWNVDVPGGRVNASVLTLDLVACLWRPTAAAAA